MKKIIFLIIILLFIFVLWAGYFTADVFLQDRQAGNDYQNFIIEAGEGINQISNNLSQAGLIKNKFNFEFYIWLLRRENKIQAGNYQLKPSMSLRQLVNIITYGWGSNERRVIIIEGWTNRQIAEYLAENLFSYYGQGANQEEYIRDFQESVKKNYNYDFLISKPDNVDLEGYLFPDTYDFYSEAEPSEVISRMLANFDKKITTELREKINNKDRTIHQVVTLASIIEREVSQEQDRRLVADIFWRRLDIGMPLQADSTVNYITGKKAVAVSAADKKVDSPYNTYKYQGLPPGPICNPSLGAIEATIDSLGNDYWYFLTTKEGEVIYSKTLAEHNQAKAKYLSH